MGSAAATPQSSPHAGPGKASWLYALVVLGLLFIFLCGVRGMGSGFNGLGKDLLQSFFAATRNPFVGLVVGILGTTLVQSSSVTTSMIVAMVAAPDNPLPVTSAIPMIMGANIGTTVTNTIVALGHVGRPDEFRRAYAAATCHDFFNFMAVAVLLPFEILTGSLEKLSHLLAGFVGTGGGGKMPNPVKSAAKAVVTPVEDVIAALFGGQLLSAMVLILVSMAAIFVSLTFLVRVLRRLASGRMQVYISRALDSSAYAGMGVGAIVTVMVQSSSITTSVLVPLAGAGIVTLSQVFPITLGANIGTTMTAVVASMAAPSETAFLAVQIAMVHLLFNLLGVFLVYPFKVTREIPLRAARWLAGVGCRSKKVAILYVLGLFYLLPALLIFVSRAF